MIDLTPIASRLAVEPRALRAILSVESSGSGLVDGHALIRVEAHLLWEHVNPGERPLIDARFRVGGPERWQGHLFDGQPYHGHQDRERAAYAVARAINPDAACRSTSFGAGQVLGDWHALGFASVAEFEAAQLTEAGQIDTFARYIERRPVLLSALRAKDWGTVARCYNGPSNMAEYSGRLAGAYG